MMGGGGGGGDDFGIGRITAVAAKQAVEFAEAAKEPTVAEQRELNPYFKEGLGDGKGAPTAAEAAADKAKMEARKVCLSLPPLTLCLPCTNGG